MKCFNRYILFLFCHLLAWNRMGATPLNLAINTTLSPPANQSEFNFAEGGVFKDVSKVDLTSPTTTLIHNKNGTENLLSELLENGAPLTGTSKVKPRKEALPRTIVARKGAPPCLETENPPCTEKTPTIIESSTKSLLISTSSESEQIENTIISSTPFRIDLLQSLPNNTLPPKKPSVTKILSDSQEFLVNLKNDRNVVIPVAALICTPILVLLALFIYKRIEDSRGNSQYTRMSYLIEDIYND